MSVKKLFEKVEMKKEPVTVSDTTKVQLLIMAFSVANFAAQFLKDLYRTQRQKINDTVCPKKRYI